MKRIFQGFNTFFVLVSIILSTGCINETWTGLGLSQASVQIPAQSDWVDYGTIFHEGAPGEWDLYLWGGFALSSIKKDGTYFLYYQGSSDYRTEYDETVLWRSIGVATSQDGINFTKYPDNPILEWFPTQNGEEGAVSSGVTIGSGGEIVMFYGANTAASSTLVNADGRVATSLDGLNFTDQGMVLNHSDGSVWGSGDELFPIDAVYDQGKWIVYYIPNGTAQSGQLGVASGTAFDELTFTAPVLNGLTPISVWGSGSHAKIDDTTIALFLNNSLQDTIEVRLTSPGSPQIVGPPVQTYQFDGISVASFLLDEEKQTWFMYYRTDTSYGVMLAPSGEPDTSPPSAPGSVQAKVLSSHQAQITWQPANDAETGIVEYIVYRNGAVSGKIKGTQFTDSGLSVGGSFQYRVSAVNLHGVEGPKSAPVTVTLYDKQGSVYLAVVRYE